MSVEIIKYIDTCRKQNFTDEQIQAKLIESGYSQQDIDAAFVTLISNQNNPFLTETEIKPKKGLPKKLFVAAFVVIVFIAAFGVSLNYLGPHINAVRQVKAQFSDHQLTQLSQKPEPLTFSENTLAAGITLGDTEYTYDSFSFKTPWSLQSESVSEDLTAKKFIYDKGEISVSAYQSVVEMFREVDEVQYQNALKVLGEDNLESDYDFFNAAMEASGDDVSFFSQPNDSLKKVLLLVIKNAFTLGEEVRIYKFTSGNLQGFDIHFVERNVHNIFLFSDGDRNYSMMINGDNLDQETVNAILSSIQMN